MKGEKVTDAGHAAQTPMADHIRHAAELMARGARMCLDAIPNDTSRLCACFGPEVTAEIARHIRPIGPASHSCREAMEKFVREARDLIELKRFDVLTVFLANYGPQLVDRGIDLDRLYAENERLTAIVALVDLKSERDALAQRVKELEDEKTSTQGYYRGTQ
jgi:hypothetical protein